MCMSLAMEGGEAPYLTEAENVEMQSVGIDEVGNRMKIHISTATGGSKQRMGARECKRGG